MGGRLSIDICDGQKDIVPIPAHKVQMDVKQYVENLSGKEQEEIESGSLTEAAEDEGY